MKTRMIYSNYDPDTGESIVKIRNKYGFLDCKKKIVHINQVLQVVSMQK